MTRKSHLTLVPAREPAAREPLRELYEKYGASVHDRCAYLLRDPSAAEDAMQEVFAKALQSYDGFRAESSPLTWLMKIATHHCLNVLRGERAAWRQRFIDEERRRSEPQPARPQAFELRHEVRKLLDRFDLETQAAAIHYHVDEMTLEEVATLLGRSVPTVRKRLEEFAAAGAEEPGQ
ncbi:MAG TPA: sigma-70 family RNA polymerase sigma factor [Polyangia bacterium]